jgi:hypothetical protein
MLQHGPLHPLGGQRKCLDDVHHVLHGSAGGVDHNWAAALTLLEVASMAILTPPAVVTPCQLESTRQKRTAVQGSQWAVI